MTRILVLLLGLLVAATTATAQGNYRIKSGDTLTIEVLEDASLNRSLLVLPDGRISLPFIGSLKVSGRTVQQTQQSITDGISANFVSPPTVFVTVSALRPRQPAAAARAPATIDVFFVGEVEAPGLKEVSPGTTFLQALAQSGGFTRFAATKRIQIRSTNKRSGRTTTRSVNYKALSDGAALAQGLVLSDGDVILVPERRLFE